MRQKNSSINRNYRHITTPMGYRLQEDYSELYLSRPLFLLSIVVAYLCSVFVFSQVIHFWLALALTSVFLIAWCIIFGNIPLTSHGFTSHLLLYTFIFTALLYLLFFVGHWVLTLIFGPMEQVNGLYGLGLQTSPLLSAFVIALIAAPSEEIFWHGFLQRAIVTKYGINTGIVVSSVLYAGAYLLVGAPILMLAALIGGLAWAWLYQYTGNLWFSILSHSLWSLTIYLLLPLI